MLGDDCCQLGIGRQGGLFKSIDLGVKRCQDSLGARDQQVFLTGKVKAIVDPRARQRRRLGNLFQRRLFVALLPEGERHRGDDRWTG